MFFHYQTINNHDRFRPEISLLDQKLIRNYLNRVVGFNEEARNTVDIKKYYEMKRKKTDDQDIVVDSGLTLPENIKSHNLVDIEKDYFNELDKLDRKNNKKPNYSSYEIDYVFFEEKFWSRMIKKKHINFTCKLVWTQIYSVIKGSKDHFHLEHEYDLTEKT